MSITQEPYVFISYAHADTPFVQQLTADLRRQGINAWIDKSRLTVGTPDWENSLRVSLSGAKAVVLIASPASRASDYVRDELRIAAMYRRRIYPVWAAGAQWMESVPMGLGGIQYVDARGPRYSIAINELVTALSGSQPLTLQVPVPPSQSGSSIYQRPVGSTQNQAVGSLSLPKKASIGKGTWACLTAALVTIAVVVVLVVVFASSFINFISGLGGPSFPGAHQSGKLLVTPSSFTLTRTQGGFNNGCFYAPRNGWTCRVTLQNISTTGSFNWSTQVSMSTITLSPSAAIIPLSAGQSDQVDITIPDSSCGHAVISFKGPENNVDVTIDCS